VEIIPQHVVEEQPKLVPTSKPMERRSYNNLLLRTSQASLCTKTCGKKGIVITCEQWRNVFPTTF